MKDSEQRQGGYIKEKNSIISIMAILVSISLLITSACSSKTTSQQQLPPQLLLHRLRNSRLNLLPNPIQSTPTSFLADDKSVISNVLKATDSMRTAR